MKLGPKTMTQLNDGPRQRLDTTLDVAGAMNVLPNLSGDDEPHTRE